MEARKIRERYDREAAGTDHLGCGLPLNGAALRPGQKILELGCGRGEEAIIAAGRVSPGGWVTGIDLSEGMILSARQRARNERVQNVDFILADIASLPLEDDTFDFAFSNCAINHAPDKEAVYRELYRVLKPGGRFSVSDVVSLEELPPEITEDPQAWADCFGGAIPEEIYLESIAKAGFTGITVVSRREYLKRGYPLASLTITARKPQSPRGGRIDETTQQQAPI